jgi:hypothetical protein
VTRYRDHSLRADQIRFAQYGKTTKATKTEDILKKATKVRKGLSAWIWLGIRKLFVCFVSFCENSSVFVIFPSCDLRLGPNIVLAHASSFDGGRLKAWRTMATKVTPCVAPNNAVNIARIFAGTVEGTISP